MKTSLSKQPEQQGFSLVELSIVLVILGLLVGGILSGQSLIRASELRSVTTEYQTYVTSLGTFRDRYFALPGDLSNAASFWSTVASGAVLNFVGDMEKATAAAEAVGDDRLQKSATGQVNPEKWTHGSAAMRARWFKRGRESGELSACDTFGAASL